MKGDIMARKIVLHELDALGPVKKSDVPKGI
jgi:hypothetical protein